MEKPVRFKVGGDHLFGMLHIPEQGMGARNRTGILFRTAGLRYRIGPYREYVRFARRFCEAGYFVLRYDAPGVGDSEGRFRNLLEYRTLFAGNNDITRQIIEFFVEQTGVKRLGVLGLCGGAYDALFTGAAFPSVSFAILLSLMVEQVDGTMPDGMGEFDMHGGWGSFAEGAKKALDTYMVQNKSALFIYGDNDPFYRAFMMRFGEKILEVCRERPSWEMYIVRKADHVFSQVGWQDEAVQKSVNWLNQL
jgi:pimeloyl-ACP methyl ester carboxylesterase